MTTKLEKLREQIERGENPSKVDLSFEGLTAFPPELIDIAEHVEMINFGGNDLCDLPEEMYKFVNLRILFFAGNKFTSIPNQLGVLPKLRMLSFKGNQIREISEDCLAPSIQWLILTDNSISHLPKAIGNLTGLRKLMLAGNRLASLPVEMANCRALELVRLASNRLEALPRWLVTLPKLSWVAFSGNLTPPSEVAGLEESWPRIPWTELAVQNHLGEGASGNVYKANLLHSIDSIEDSYDYGEVDRCAVLIDAVANLECIE